MGMKRFRKVNARGQTGSATGWFLSRLGVIEFLLWGLIGCGVVAGISWTGVLGGEALLERWRMGVVRLAVRRRRRSVKPAAWPGPGLGCDPRAWTWVGQGNGPALVG
jgi:hypothetical protein